MFGVLLGDRRKLVHKEEVEAKQEIIDRIKAEGHTLYLSENAAQTRAAFEGGNIKHAILGMYMTTHGMQRSAQEVLARKDVTFTLVSPNPTYHVVDIYAENAHNVTHNYLELLAQINTYGSIKSWGEYVRSGDAYANSKLALAKALERPGVSAFVPKQREIRFGLGA